MSIKDKIMNVITTHPKIVILGTGLAITFAIGAAIGMVDHQAFAGDNHAITATGGVMKEKFISGLKN